MAEKETKKPQPPLLPKKTYWHLYSLQNLQAEKMVRVVNKVLRKDFVLIK